MPVLVPDQPTGMQDQPPPGELQQVWNRLRETPIGLGIRSAFYGDQDAQYKLGVLNAQPRSYGAAAAMSPEMSFYEGMREAPGVTLGGATLGVLPTAAGARALTATPGVALAAPRGAMRYWRYLDKQYPYVMRPLGMGIGAAVGPYVPQWLHSLWHGLSHE
ncbi:MAG: hypothetical protein C5B60_05870 [Chloroflexi bacterium]|nr:MAG: hypothetical protein C5B60_05870 [Chloroflexota bacterium]